MNRQFSDVFRLSANDIDRILDLEYRVCIPPIQVSRERLEQRFGVGNLMLGVQRSPDAPTLVSTLAFRYAQFSPDNSSSFPKVFARFSTPPERVKDFNAAFVYSFNVDPEERRQGNGLSICRKIMAAGFETMRIAGCKYLVADGRPTSYNGSSEYPQERQKQILEFKQAIDDYLAGGPFPQEKVLMLEPTWRVYRHFLRSIRPLWIIPNFFPPDTPAGGLRVILYGEM